MLLNVLPGLRDLRAPLSAGFVWLLALWIIFDRKLQDLAAAQVPPVSSVTSAAHLVGRPGTIAALAFSAYVIGLLSSSVTNLAYAIGNWVVARPRLIWISPGGRNYRTSVSPLQTLFKQRLTSRVMTNEVDCAFLAGRRVSDPSEISSNFLQPIGAREQVPSANTASACASYDQAYHLVEATIDVDWYVERLRELVGPRLTSVTASDVFAVADRYRAEAEFRTSLWLPLSVLAAAIAVHQPLWSIPLFVTAAILVYQGDALDAHYQAVISAGILAGKVGSNEVDLLVGSPLALKQSLADSKPAS
jgi:hypothetical protein